jgi:nitrogen fixation protein NifQ
MESAEFYGWLMQGGERSACDAFDAHVVASVLSLAVGEADHEGTSVVNGLGLGAQSLTEMVAEIFPHARPLFERLGPGQEPQPAEDESSLRELLLRYTTVGTPLEERLAAIIARRALRPNHLWQDLGLRHRRELSWLMSRHFEGLATKNSQDMKWKKFLYRTICRDEGFVLCTAPSCGECSDFDRCFGDESGEALLATLRRTASPTVVK